MTVAQRINFYLKANDISVNSLSKMTGISTKRLNSILTSGKPMRYGDFLKIILALEVEPNTFLEPKKPGEILTEESNNTFKRLMVNILQMSERNLKLLLSCSNGLLKNGYQKELKKDLKSMDKMEVAL